MEWHGLRHHRGSRFGDQQQVLCQNHLRRSGHGRDEFTTKHVRLSLRVDSACVCTRVCTCGVLILNLTGASYLPVLPRPARAGHFRQHLTLDALFRLGQLRVLIGRGCDMSGVVRECKGNTAAQLEQPRLCNGRTQGKPASWHRPPRWSASARVQAAAIHGPRCRRHYRGVQGSCARTCLKRGEGKVAPIFLPFAPIHRITFRLKWPGFGFITRSLRFLT